MKDISALFQTMQLEKFKWINNKFINKQRSKHRDRIYFKVRGTDYKFKTPNKSENKNKYLGKLFLYKEILNLGVKNAIPECNINWPICIYDHNHQSRYISYLAFRCANEPKIIDDYFDITSFSFDKFHKDNKDLSSDLNNEFLIPETLKQKAYNSLVIERNCHYCTNKDFVNKIKKLLEHDRTDWAFDGFGICSDVNDDTRMVNPVDAYIEFINDVDYEIMESEEKNSKLIKTPDLKSKNLLECKTESDHKKPFRLEMYISSISPRKKHH